MEWRTVRGWREINHADPHRSDAMNHELGAMGSTFAGIILGVVILVMFWIAAYVYPEAPECTPTTSTTTTTTRPTSGGF